MFLCRWISITNSLLKVNDDVYVNARGYLSSLWEDDGQNASVVVRMVNYKDEQPSQTIKPTEAYPETNAIFATVTKLQSTYNPQEHVHYQLQTQNALHSKPLLDL